MAFYLMTFHEKQEKIKGLFSRASSAEEMYQLLIELGKGQLTLSPEDKSEENRVRGCQSLTYLKTEYKEGKLYFSIESDAFISAGLGQILTRVYSGESPETVLRELPTYIEEVGLRSALSPGRSSGLSSMWERLRKEALAYYLSSQND